MSRAVLFISAVRGGKGKEFIKNILQSQRSQHLDTFHSIPMYAPAKELISNPDIG
jgi:hypothetical protein